MSTTQKIRNQQRWLVNAHLTYAIYNLTMSLFLMAILSPFIQVQIIQQALSVSIILYFMMFFLVRYGYRSSKEWPHFLVCGICLLMLFTLPNGINLGQLNAIGWLLLPWVAYLPGVPLLYFIVQHFKLGKALRQVQVDKRVAETEQQDVTQEAPSVVEASLQNRTSSSHKNQQIMDLIFFAYLLTKAWSWFGFQTGYFIGLIMVWMIVQWLLTVHLLWRSYRRQQRISLAVWCLDILNLVAGLFTLGSPEMSAVWRWLMRRVPEGLSQMCLVLLPMMQVALLVALYQRIKLAKGDNNDVSDDQQETEITSDLPGAVEAEAESAVEPSLESDTPLVEESISLSTKPLESDHQQDNPDEGEVEF